MNLVLVKKWRTSKSVSFENNPKTEFQSKLYPTTVSITRTTQTDRNGRRLQKIKNYLSKTWPIIKQWQQHSVFFFRIVYGILWRHLFTFAVKTKCSLEIVDAFVTSDWPDANKVWLRLRKLGHDNQATSYLKSNMN